TEAAPTVVGDEDVRLEVAGPMAVEGDVESVRVVVRRFDPPYVRSRRHTGEPVGQLGPLAAVVACHPDAAIIGAGEEPALPQRALGERHDRTVRLRTG